MGAREEALRRRTTTSASTPSPITGTVYGKTAAQCATLQYLHWRSVDYIQYTDSIVYRILH